MIAFIEMAIDVYDHFKSFFLLIRLEIFLCQESFRVTCMPSGSNIFVLMFSIDKDRVPKII